jgi:hypothetical protein
VFERMRIFAHTDSKRPQASRYDRRASSSNARYDKGFDRPKVLVKEDVLESGIFDAR